MRFLVFYRKSLRDSYDSDPPNVEGVAFEHVATVDVPVAQSYRVSGEPSPTEGALETLFRVMNVVDGNPDEIPPKIRNRSMSVGDLAVTSEGMPFVVCRMGWTACAPTAIAKLTITEAPMFSV